MTTQRQTLAREVDMRTGAEGSRGGGLRRRRRSGHGLSPGFPRPFVQPGAPPSCLRGAGRGTPGLRNVGERHVGSTGCFLSGGRGSV